MQSIEESLEYEGIDLLSDFGGYLGLFIGASALSLSNIALNYFFQMMPKLKNRVGSGIRVGQIVEDEYTEGQQETERTQGTSPTPHRMSPLEIEITLIKIQEDLAKKENKIKSKPHGLSKRNKKGKSPNKPTKE